MQSILIFISSPGDVAEERDRARQVVEQLGRRYAGQLVLKAVLWEELPLRADTSFQQGIDLILSKERGIDIAVFILWSRLGSPLGALIRKPDGSSYRSGTEREFDLLMAARAQSGTDTPKVLVYTRRDEASFDERLRGKPTAEKTQLIAQKQLVESFIQEEFQDAATGSNLRAYHSFDQPVTFSQRLRIHLQEVLDPLAGGSVGEPVWDIAKQGPPFRGLEAFDLPHNAVFFGREDEVLEVRRALQRKAREGCAFVLISGASGSGKSSLAHAGVAPAVVEHEVDSAVNSWRFGAGTPSQFAGELCGGLARLLCSENVLPELRIRADSPAVLAEGFATAPKLTVDQSLRPALARASQGKPGATRLLLLVDQLEELFTDKGLTDENRNHFMEMLEALARSGVVWVLATVRGDFYQHCQRIPVLMRLKEGPGQIDLLPPSADALRRLIEHPARLAGLGFEERDGKSLADRILTDAAAHAELLPLLSYLLRELFEQRTPAGVLTFAAYDQLGGVEGALAKRAETVFRSLAPEAQDELSPALRLLVSVSGDDEESVVRQRVPLVAFPPNTPLRALVDRFVSERFLVTEKGREGAGSVSVAHEALLRVWNRAAQWVADNREFLRLRARVSKAAQDWEESRRHDDYLLPEGRKLTEAEELRQKWTLSSKLVEFIGASQAKVRRMAEDKENRRLQHLDELRSERDRALKAKARTKWALVVALLLALLAGIGAWVGFKGQALASANERRAQAAQAASLKEAAKSRQVATFLTKMLDGVGPSVALGRDTKMLREILDKTAERVGQDLKDQPEVEAELRNTLGNIYEELGDYTKADDMIRRALALRKSVFGDQHPRVADSLNDLGRLLEAQGKPAEAEALFRQALALRREFTGNESSEAAEGLNNLGVALLDQGRLTEAEAAHREALTLSRKLFGDEHPDVATCLQSLANVLLREGKTAEAESLYRQAVAMRRKLLGDAHPLLATSLGNLGFALWYENKFSEAETAYRETLAMQRKLIDDEHPAVATSLHNLACVLQSQGKLLEAEAFGRQALEIRRKRLGAENPDFASTLSALAAIYQSQGRFGEAETAQREALPIQRKSLGPTNQEVGVSLNNLGDILRVEGKFAEADDVQREAVTVLKSALGGASQLVAVAIDVLGNLLRDEGKLAQAETAQREALAMRRQVLAADHPDIAQSLNDLAAVLRAQGRLEEAEPLYREALGRRRKSLGNEHPDTIDSLTGLAGLLQERDKFAEAEGLMRECLPLCKELLAEDWRFFDAKARLAGILVAQTRYAEAEPLLIAGYDGMKQRQDSIPAGSRRRLKETARCAAVLYGATARSAQAADWKKKEPEE